MTNREMERVELTSSTTHFAILPCGFGLTRFSVTYAGIKVPNSVKISRVWSRKEVSLLAVDDRRSSYRYQHNIGRLPNTEKEMLS